MKKQTGRKQVNRMKAKNLTKRKVICIKAKDYYIRSSCLLQIISNRNSIRP